jgi:hypothetical protein
MSALTRVLEGKRTKVNIAKRGENAVAYVNLKQPFSLRFNSRGQSEKCFADLG